MEIRFPTDVSYGSRGGPGYNTNIVVTDGGNEERVARWQNAKRAYDVRWGAKSRDQMQSVVAFYHVVQGAAYSFRFKDWLDYDTTSSSHGTESNPSISVSSADQVLGTGDGTTTVFQLVKRYSQGGNTRVRTITKPVAGTVVCAINGTPTVAFTVDTTTGLVTFNAAPAAASALTAGFQFDVPVRFGKSADKVLMAAVEDYGWGQLDPIELVEVPDGLAVNDDAYCGGAVEVCLTNNWLLSAGYARGYIFEPQSAGLIVQLPDPIGQNLPTGGPMFWLLNLGPFTITVKTFAGATFLTLASGSGADVLLTVDGAGSKIWYAV